MMHLRNMSPYVASALGEWVRQRGRVPRIPLAAQAFASAGVALPYSGAALALHIAPFLLIHCFRHLTPSSSLRS